MRALGVKYLTDVVLSVVAEKGWRGEALEEDGMEVAKERLGSMGIEIRN